MGIKGYQKGFSVVEIVLVLVVIGLLGFIGWTFWSRQASNTTQNSTSNSSNNSSQQSSSGTGVEIPEIGVKIADPENRGLKVYYDNSGSDSTNGEHCIDTNVTDGYTCMYYLYDNKTADSAKSAPSSNAADFAKYYACDSDLTIYESNPEYDSNPASNGEYTGLVKIDSKSISLWAHGPQMDACDDATSASVNTYIKDLLQYVKANISKL